MNRHYFCINLYQFLPSSVPHIAAEVLYLRRLSQLWSAGRDHCRDEAPNLPIRGSSPIVKWLWRVSHVMFLQDLFFFSATQLFRSFCKKAAKKSPWVVWRYQASRSGRFAELHAAHFCQPRNLRRWVVRTVVQLVRGYIWMPFRGMNRFIIEDIEYTGRDGHD